MIENTGARIKQLRMSKGISISKLSKEIRVSRSLISQVENGQALPSLPTLGKIVEAIGVTLSEFFNMDETTSLHEKDIIVRKNAHRMVFVPETNSSYQMLTPNSNAKMQFFISEFPPGDVCSSKLPSIHKGEEFFYVVEGNVCLRVGDSTYKLEQGDSGSFDSSISHEFGNPGDETAKVLMATI